MRYILTVQNHDGIYATFANTKQEINETCDNILTVSPDSVIIISEYIRTVTKHSENLYGNK